MPQKIFGKATKIYTLSKVKVYNALISLVNSSVMIYTELGPGIGPKILTARGDAALGFHKSLPGQLRAAHQRGAMSCVMARLKNEKESAEYIGLEVATFRAWVESGRLPQPIPDCGKYDARSGARSHLGNQQPDECTRRVARDKGGEECGCGLRASIRL
jgi:hypothetical protein